MSRIGKKEIVVASNIKVDIKDTKWEIGGSTCIVDVYPNQFKGSFAVQFLGCSQAPIYGRFFSFLT